MGCRLRVLETSGPSVWLYIDVESGISVLKVLGPRAITIPDFSSERAHAGPDTTGRGTSEFVELRSDDVDMPVMTIM
jgi:hypothetical protein